MVVYELFADRNINAKASKGYNENASIGESMHVNDDVCINLQDSEEKYSSNRYSLLPR